MDTTQSQTAFLKEEVHVIMNKKKRYMKEGEVQIVILNQARKLPIKRKGPYHEDESREKTAQRILRRRKGQDNANADALCGLNSTPYFMPEKEGGM